MELEHTCFVHVDGNLQVERVNREEESGFALVIYFHLSKFPLNAMTKIFVTLPF